MRDYLKGNKKKCLAHCQLLSLCAMLSSFWLSNNQYEVYSVSMTLNKPDSSPLVLRASSKHLLSTFATGLSGFVPSHCRYELPRWHPWKAVFQRWRQQCNDFGGIQQRRGHHVLILSVSSIHGKRNSSTYQPNRISNIHVEYSAVLWFRRWHHKWSRVPRVHRLDEGGRPCGWPLQIGRRLWQWFSFYLPDG